MQFVVDLTRDNRPHKEVAIWPINYLYAYFKRAQKKSIFVSRLEYLSIVGIFCDKTCYKKRINTIKPQ